MKYRKIIKIILWVQTKSFLDLFTLQVATVLVDPGVFPTWSKQTGTVVPEVHEAETPQTQTLFRHRLLNVGPHGSAVPHLQLLREAQVSVVKVHSGLHKATKK